MTDPVAGMQFETAEPTTEGSSSPEVRCAACGDKLADYFEVNGAVACSRCKDKVLKAAGASHVPTFLKATGLGLIAAIVGSALYYAVAALTGYEIGLISIVVGLLVGFAVRKGSSARGGWRYQTLAMFLTYLAIASTYVPRVFKEMAEQKAEDASSPAAGAPAAPQKVATQPVSAQPTAPPATASTTPGATPAKPSPTKVDETAAGRDTANKDVTFGQFIVAMGLLFAFTLALPFLAGFDNVMGLVIIAIGLYEAWKVNRRPAFSVTGPFSVGAPKAADA